MSTPKAHMEITESTSIVVRKNGLEFNVTANHRIDFWHRVESGAWEPGTFKVFDHFLDQDTVYVDIGAWVGPTLLYAAQCVKASHAFEPDPVAFEELSRNLQSNDQAAWRRRVQIYWRAVDHQAGKLKLGNPRGGGDSMTSVLFSNESASWEVETISLPDFFAEHDLRSGKVFVKMDIEGAEYQLLPHLRELLSQPDLVLYLSVHPWLLLQTRRDAGNQLSKIWRRLLVAFRHTRLLSALPFRHLYHEDGRPIGLMKESLRAIIFGAFTTTLVATHKPWEAYTARCE